MRVAALTLLSAALLMSCGGGDSVGPKPPSPPPAPPAPGPAASISVQAGDGQSAEPGTAVAVNPTVLVRDSNGRPVANVSISFAVDSGGGSIENPTATTGTDGIASAGRWTLGPGEGRNLVVARSGSLAPAAMTATGVYATVSIGTENLGAGGGTVAVTQGVLSGFKLEVASGAYPGGASLTISHRASAGIPTVAPIQIASRLVTLESSTADPAAQPMQIRIPARIGADEIPLVAAVDQVDGFLRALPTVDFDSTGATAELPALTPFPTFPQASGSQLRGSAARASMPPGRKLQLVVYVTKQVQVRQQPIDATFRPGIDDWDFSRQDTPPGATALGQVLTAQLIYKRKGPGGPPLWDRFDRAPGIPTSNTLGISWTAGFQQAHQGQVAAHFNTAMARRARNPIWYDLVTEVNLLMAMLLSRQPQVMIVASPSGSLQIPTLGYRWAGASGKLFYANPHHPGDLNRGLDWATGSPDCNGPCVVVIGFDYFDAVLDPEWLAVQADNAPYAHAFPQAFFNYSGGAVSTGLGGNKDTLFLVGDTASVWTTVPSWPHELAPPAPGVTKTQLQLVYFQYPGGNWAASTIGSSSSAYLLQVSDLATSATDRGVNVRMGIEARAVWPPVNDPSISRWTGFTTTRILKFRPMLSGSQAPAGQNTVLTLSNDGGPPLPAGYTYLIDWNDGVVDTYRSRPATVTKIYNDDKKHTVKIKIFHPTLQKMVAMDSLEIGGVIVNPNPLVGNSDVDYPLKASYIGPIPPHATWQWDLGDGRTLTTTTDTVSVRFPTNIAVRADTFDITVTLLDGTTEVSSGRAKALITMVAPAWKITSFTVGFFTQESTPNPPDPTQSICYPCWVRDSTMWVRLASRVNDIGLYYVGKTTTVSPLTIARGLYLLEGTNITPARLTTVLDYISEFDDNPPSPGRIVPHWLVSGRASRGPIAWDPQYSESYVETGSLTNGTIVGTAWGPSQPLGSKWFPLNVRQANVRFSGNVATGTLRYAFRVGDRQFEAWRTEVNVTFTAQRIQ